MSGAEHLRGHIDAALLTQIEADLKAGGSLIGHLSRRLGADAAQTWQTLAERGGRLFFASPSACGPIDTRLLGEHQALDYLVVPRVRSFNRVHLLSPEPLPRIREYLSLLPHFAPMVPGAQPVIKIDVTTPECFRELFALAYPGYETRYRDVHDALGLAALLPRRGFTPPGPGQSKTGQSGTGQSGTGQSGTGQSGTGQSGTGQFKPTETELSVAAALYLGVAYLDPVARPPDLSALGDTPIEPFLARRLYPHSLDERGRLLVLGSATNAAALEAEHLKITHLSEALLRPMDLALTGMRPLARLIGQHGESHV